MITIPIWVLAAVLALAGAKVMQTPAGGLMRKGAKKTARLIVPKKQPRVGDKVILKCVLAEQGEYHCIVDGRREFVVSPGNSREIIPTETVQ